MNPRRIVVEDRVLSLADELEDQASLVAARLRETVPDHFGTASDEDGGDDAYHAYWEDGDWLEQSPCNLGRDQVLAWARARTDVIRCSLEPDDEVAVVVRALGQPG